MTNFVTRPKSSATRIALPSLLILMGFLLALEALASSGVVALVALLFGCLIIAQGIFGLVRFARQRAAKRSTP